MGYNRNRGLSSPRSRGQTRSFGPSNNRRNTVKHGQYIDPARFVKVAKPIAQEDYVPTHKFEDFEIHQTLKANIAHKGFTEPTPIQDQTIPAALEGKDVIGIANTGTGKTAAFGVPILHKLMTDRQAKALIVAPTRELAQQIEQEIASISKNTGVYGVVLIGGTAMGPQLHRLRSNPRLVIGTPGRIKDHLERGSLRLNGFNFAVLDEVDRMLDMGFVNDVRQILSMLDPNRQSLFFSATLDARVNGLIQTFSKDPITVSIKAGETSENVHQDVIRYAGNVEKMDKLHNALINGEVKAIVFDETQRGVERLNKELLARGFKTDAIHGGKSQGQRQRALNRFKSNEVQVLVATDVAARGIDVADVTHIVNYSQPKTYDDYIHRIGRTGRAGKIGHALTFVAH
ncbi:MAG: putative box helicase domain protein [Candidatus Saccharibacteria bacterium]|nr:putative box helicase domain protein [Candidatus Saccharibacteria bacterium]